MDDRARFAQDLFKKWTSDCILDAIDRETGKLNTAGLHGVKVFTVACFEVSDVFFDYLSNRTINID